MRYARSRPVFDDVDYHADMRDEDGQAYECASRRYRRMPLVSQYRCSILYYAIDMLGRYFITKYVISTASHDFYYAISNEIRAQDDFHAEAVNTHHASRHICREGDKASKRRRRGLP